MPEDSDDYVHRVGRTGRMGRDGVAFTFIVPGQGDFLTSIEQRINKLLIRDSIPGFEAPEKPAEPEKKEADPMRKRLNPMHRKVKRRR